MTGCSSTKRNEFLVVGTRIRLTAYLDHQVELSDDQLDHIECFYLLLLSRSNRILGNYQLSKGGISGTVADPKCIFQVALKCNASALILAHNHPSGNLKPSEMDIRLIRKLVEVDKLLELPVYISTL